MALTRLDSDERRRAIVLAAVPLFARRGFAGTTTKELAEAAGISEALLFRHFPSKKQLYEAISHLGCEGDPALERLASLEPSSATLAHMVHFMVRHFLALDGNDRCEIRTKLRLILHSCLEDGEYVRELSDRIFERVHPLFAASIEAAHAAGDLRPGPIASANGFWFAQHVAAMMAAFLLPGEACVPYRGDAESLADEAAWFVLRGIGMTEAAIAAALVPAQSPSSGRPKAGPVGRAAD
jgi:TetR/AcrR family transcriptional regulator, transcriptional repressor of aconitase